MAPPPAAPRASTLKQAKAAFKARSHPTLCEREKKQLQRSIQLEQRAWAAREREKRRAEVVRVNAEKERKRKREREEEQVRPGERRRRDQFGHESSQLCLRAFFGKGVGLGLVEEGKENLRDWEVQGGEEDVFEDGVDDESLLEALTSPLLPATNSGITSPPARPLGKSPPVPEPLPQQVVNDFAAFWDELDSSTQIARELDTDAIKPVQPKRDTQTASVCSRDRSLSAGRQGRQATSSQPKRDMDRELMPPPALPSRPKPLPADPAIVTRSVTPTKCPQRSAAAHTGSRTVPQCSSVPLPKLARTAATPGSKGQVRDHGTGEREFAAVRDKSPRAIMPTADFGFSLAEMEGFVDDDLQLTQVAPG